MERDYSVVLTYPIVTSTIYIWGGLIMKPGKHHSTVLLSRVYIKSHYHVALTLHTKQYGGRERFVFRMLQPRLTPTKHSYSLEVDWASELVMFVLVIGEFNLRGEPSWGHSMVDGGFETFLFCLLIWTRWEKANAHLRQVWQNTGRLCFL